MQLHKYLFLLKSLISLPSHHPLQKSNTKKVYLAFALLFTLGLSGCGGESIDTDGVGDNADAFPLDATEQVDTDGDGVGDNADAFPLDATEQVDTDGDGVGDNADAFPLDATEQVDTDGDGVGDNADAFPLDATEQVDTDGDGVGDNADAFPLDATEQMDTDGDGVGDNADVDDYLNTNVYSLQEQIDAGGNDTIINLNGDVLYVFDRSLSLRNYSGVHIKGNGATIKRAGMDEISTELSFAYDGTDTIELIDIPKSFSVGDRIAIAKGQSIGDVTTDPREIIEINGNTIKIKSTFNGSYNTGDTVFKTFQLIKGMFSHIEGGSNPSTIIEGINFDGNARENSINYGWLINGTILLHGGKTSEIRNNIFTDIPNETIIGHGVKVHHNEFTGLNGSAFHTSVHDNTKSINGLASFTSNTVINVNRIKKGLSGHSEGAVTFSWGAGNLTVENNYFKSYSGNYGVLGVFGGSIKNADENLTVRYNEAYNFEYIIRIAAPTKNISITENLFDATGVNDFSHFISNETIKFGCNTLTNGTEIIGNLAC